MYIRKHQISKCKTQKNCKIKLGNVLQDLLQNEMYCSSSLNKTAQQNSQHCTKLHNEVQTCCTIKFTENLNFCVFLFRKTKFTSPIKYSSCWQRHSTNLVNTTRFINCAIQLLCTFCRNFCCTLCCTFWCIICCIKSLYILRIVSKYCTACYTLTQISALQNKELLSH